MSIAKQNAQKLGTNVTFYQGNLLESLNDAYVNDAVLCCNLPYMPDSFTINQAAMFEPKIAIFGGDDGLDYYRQLFDQIASRRLKPAAILTESLPSQHGSLQEIAELHGFALKKTVDFIQHFEL